MKLRRTFVITRIITALIVPLFVTACASWLPSAHQIEIVEGNAIKSEDINKLEIGQNKKEVISIIGSPTLRDPFHADRWDYFYIFRPSNSDEANQPLKSRVTLEFEGDILKVIDISEYKEAKL